MTCACLGSLQSVPTRLVVHGPVRCTSQLRDSEELVVVEEPGCPRCSEVRAMVRRGGGALCDGCRFNSSNEVSK